MEKERNQNQDLHITAMETDLGWIKKDVAEIKDSIRKLETNCIPSIGRKLIALEANQKILMAFMFCVVAALISLYFR